MSIEDKLQNWTGPSSETEQEKQDRTERMIRNSIDDYNSFDNVDIDVYIKGSYANNTNVRVDSDVDVAVECRECIYLDEEQPNSHEPLSPYEGPWTPDKLRQDLTSALKAKFGNQVDETGNVALEVHSSSARVDADVVPCFRYRYYFSSENYREGTKIFTSSGDTIVNYPKQQIRAGRNKNKRTNYAYKKAVRILKRVENEMVSEGKIDEMASYFIECLVFNCPDNIFKKESWTSIIKGVLYIIWDDLEGGRPADNDDRWIEANKCFYLFHQGQDWTRTEAREFAFEAWNYLDLSNE